MDRDNSPKALCTKLFEECRSIDSRSRCEGVGVDQRSPKNARQDDCRASTEELAAVSGDGTSDHPSNGTDNLYSSGMGDRISIRVDEHCVE